MKSLAIRSLRAFLARRTPLTALRIDIEPTKITRSGQLYRVHHRGEVLLDGVREPLLDACVIFRKRGLRGHVEMFLKGSDTPRLRAEISCAKQFTVRENSSSGPRFVRRTESVDMFSQFYSADAAAPVPVTAEARTGSDLLSAHAEVIDDHP
mgnify:CR=1 FL=1